MIAQIVFDLPLEGPFDYLIPQAFETSIMIGMPVHVSFGPRRIIGFVIGLIVESSIKKLKTILALKANVPVFNSLDLDFARDFGAYYGCSLGEALAVLLRSREGIKPAVKRVHQSDFFYFQVYPKDYRVKIQEIIAGINIEEPRVLILVPDASKAQVLMQGLKVRASIKMGMRSSVFEIDGAYDHVIIVDEENSSYKQEQVPMYETRHVLIDRARRYGVDVSFVGLMPSVELKALVDAGSVKCMTPDFKMGVLPRLVDLTNYKFVPGLLSPPVSEAILQALKVEKKILLVLNRRGAYRLTRCVNCTQILKCQHCDSPLTLTQGQYSCSHCTFKVQGDILCSHCHLSNFRSVGIGIEQLQKELKKYFPQAKIAAFQRSKNKAGYPEDIVTIWDDADILIATNAILRFEGQWQAAVVAVIDFDAEINRLAIQSSFEAFSLVGHLSSMVTERIFIQTRNSKHYVLSYLTQGDWQGYYTQELTLRKEFGFVPYKHWVKISWRGKIEEMVRQAAESLYQLLIEGVSKGIHVTPPLVDAISRKRDQYRINVMVQADAVIPTVAFIKVCQAKVKRYNRVIMTLNIDP